MSWLSLDCLVPILTLTYKGGLRAQLGVCSPESNLPEVLPVLFMLSFKRTFITQPCAGRDYGPGKGSCQVSPVGKPMVQGGRMTGMQTVTVCGGTLVRNQAPVQPGSREVPPLLLAGMGWRMEAPLKAWRRREKHGKFPVASVARARGWEERRGAAPIPGAPGERPALRNFRLRNKQRKAPGYSWLLIPLHTFLY